MKAPIEYRLYRKSPNYRFSFRVGSTEAETQIRSLRNTIRAANVNNPNPQRVVVRYREPIGDGYYDYSGNLIGGEKCAQRGDVYVYEK